MSWGILFRVRARGNPPLGFCAAGILFRVRARGNPPLGFCAAGILFRVRARGSVRVLSNQHRSLCPISPLRSVESFPLVLSNQSFSFFLGFCVAGILFRVRIWGPVFRVRWPGNLSVGLLAGNPSFVKMKEIFYEKAISFGLS